MIVGNKEYKIEIPETDQEKIIGLSNKESLAEDEGMLFKNVNVITTEDMSFPIKVAFLDEAMSIIDIKYGPPGSTTELANLDAIHALELHEEAPVELGDTVLDDEEYIFDYRSKVKGRNGVKFTLNNYGLAPNGIAEEKEARVNGFLYKKKDINLEVELAKVGKKIYTYGAKKLQVLDDNGNVQMETDHGSRIFSIKDTKRLIKKAKKAESNKDFANLALLMFNIIDEQDSRDPEYV